MKHNIKIIARNKKAFFDFNIKKEYICGVILKGAEVKSIKYQKCNLQGAFVIHRDNRLFIKNLNIPKYKYSNDQNYDPKRERELLLKKYEISRLIPFLDEKGMSIIPTEIFIKNNFIKIKIGIGKGRKKIDKKELIKNRDIQRNLKIEAKNLNI